MTDEETIEAATARLLRKTGVFDNPATNMREIWENGRLKHERPRAGCNGVFYAEWGAYDKSWTCDD